MGQVRQRNHQAVVNFSIKGVTVATQLADSEDCDAFLIYYGVKLLTVNLHIGLIFICPAILTFTCQLQVFTIFLYFHTTVRVVGRCGRAETSKQPRLRLWLLGEAPTQTGPTSAARQAISLTSRRQTGDMWICYSFPVCVFIFLRFFNFFFVVFNAVSPSKFPESTRLEVLDPTADAFVDCSLARLCRWPTPLPTRSRGRSKEQEQHKESLLWRRVLPRHYASIRLEEPVFARLTKGSDQTTWLERTCSLRVSVGMFSLQLSSVGFVRRSAEVFVCFVVCKAYVFENFYFFVTMMCVWFLLAATVGQVLPCLIWVQRVGRPQKVAHSTSRLIIT